MTIVGIRPDAVIGGIDTHADAHVAAAVNHVGGVLDVESFRTTTTGYRSLVRWLRSHGEVALVGVEGTGSYGVGVARYLQAAGIDVVEVGGCAVAWDGPSVRCHGDDATSSALAANLSVLMKPPAILGISSEVIDLRILKPLDWQTSRSR